MILKSVKLKNFRCYKDEVIVPFQEITGLIGKNDAGKSTILEALEIFFNNSIISCEKNDLNIYAESENIEISCTFTDLPANITLDTSSETSLQNEYLLNLQGELEIKKVFKATASKPNEKVFIVANHPSQTDLNDLLLLKITDLRKRAKKLNIPKENYNANNNASLRRAIWNNCDNLNLKLQEIPADKLEAKNIYESLVKYMPMFSLFQSDRASTDNEKEVTDPMKIAVEKALKEVETEIENIKNIIQSTAMDTANRTLEKLQEMDKDLAQSLSTEFKSEPKWNSIFKLNINSDNGIPINKRGSGIRRLILLNFFRAEAERKVQDTNQNIIYAFEEPETSLHPNHQIMLIESFLSLSSNPKSQIILTTHTPNLASMLPLESLIYIDSNNKNNKVQYGTDEVYSQIVSTLGVLPDNNIDGSKKAILLVEGKSDIVFVRHLCNKLKEGNAIPYTLEEKGFALLSTGGSGNLKSWINLKIVEQFNIPWCLLQDSDIGSNEENKNKKKKQELESKGIKMYLTRKREPENYIHTDCLNFDVNFDDYSDAKVLINQADPNNVSRNKILETYFPKMSFENIREVEEYEDSYGNIRYEFTEMINDFLSIVD
ncbi:TPA: ATP-binding protein [Staphylococcus aureus]|uniref:ATP-binding protein n=1 Tax=Mammaliicoccus sciuri TaxID=1296 RepID=UPI0015E621A2|nr:ATP-binding protein [Mammaliicoccus sciuri]HDE6890406.1 ATP-binding protein [Staphylococcus aureus]MBA1397417.1 AAA family ATPase [Mammaliicoccus sciuri]MBG9211753.1 ATP-binding protein [Mammaliicoccus sciuri]MEB6259621.1 ATP-binding protein [Mammaliicoccus sciuri]MEB8191850.1 ATP-binding protein [Mammaliicoccus sciuri]